jgi:hypothetical protein
MPVASGSGMNILNVPVIVALGGALIVMGCDRPGPEAPPPVAQGSPATAPRPAPPVSDPSLPPAASAVGSEAASAPTARDTTANNPNGELTKRQESNEMPRANQANNHSSPALDPAPSRKP